MSDNAAPKVFLSHSHQDKQVARRLVRRLTAHGIKIWIDERELQVGTVLTSSIRAQIERADTLLVIASRASAESNWVGLELDFAREHKKPIVPIFVEPVKEHERFGNDLGIDATHPQSFADVVHGLMHDLFSSFDIKMPPADPAVLTRGLRELAKEEPNLAPLIFGCLSSEGLHQENIDTVCNVAFHALDDALNALFDLTPNEHMAYHAAYGFNRAGAGARALSLWIDATADGEGPLVTAVGTRVLEPKLIPRAIKLLASCSSPNNHALYQFIHHSFAQFDEAQRRSVIRLVTWPVRANTDCLGDVLGWVALKHFPDAEEIQLMWTRWISNAAFDGGTSSPRDLARYLTDAHKEGLPGWEPVNEALCRHVRQCVRSGDKNKVHSAICHIQAAADVGAPVLAALLTEATTGTAEWDHWKERDPEVAERMGWILHFVREEAQGDRDWLRALKRAEEMVEFEKLLRGGKS